MNFMQFFSEDNGQLSNVRLLGTLCVLTALFIVILCYLSPTGPDGTKRVIDIGIVTTLLVAGFGPKVVQKYSEEKPGPDSDKGGQ